MTTNEQLAKVFEDAIEYLSLTERDYMCLAIDRTSHTPEDKKAAKNVILARLKTPYYRHSDIYYWLVAKGNPPSELTVEYVQDYRHKCLIALVEEFNGS